jgi:hypothetical protein
MVPGRTASKMQESSMSTIFTSRLVAFGAAALLTAGVASTARADVAFRNVTGEPIHFGFSCDGYGQDAWTVAPYRTLSIYCNNGSRVATVEIRTAHRHHDEVVRSTVWDGRTYELGFDGDGDVNIWRG